MDSDEGVVAMEEGHLVRLQGIASFSWRETYLDIVNDIAADGDDQTGPPETGEGAPHLPDDAYLEGGTALAGVQSRRLREQFRVFHGHGQGHYVSGGRSNPCLG